MKTLHPLHSFSVYGYYVTTSYNISCTFSCQQKHTISEAFQPTWLNIYRLTGFTLLGNITDLLSF